MEAESGPPSAPFLGISKDKDIRSVRTLSPPDAEAFYQAHALLQKYERDLFPYATLLQSYQELETALHDYAQPSSERLFSSIRWSSQVVLHPNRLIMNYLASFRAFLDHSETRFVRTFGRDSAEYRDLKANMALHYDNSFSYPFVYKLRHFAQHCGLPLGNIETSSMEDPPGSKKVKHELRVCFVRDKLLSDFDDWGRVRAQIAAKPEQWDIAGDLGRVMTACTDIQVTILTATVQHVLDAANLVDALRREVPDADAFVFVGTMQAAGNETWKLRINELPTHVSEMVLKEHADLRRQ